MTRTPWTERLDLTLHLLIKIREARNTFSFRDREFPLLDVMRQVEDLPRDMRQLGRQGALFTAGHAFPGGDAIHGAADWLEKDISRERSNAERLVQAIEAGSLTRGGPVQDRLLDVAERLYRKLAVRFPGAAEKIAQAEQRTFGIIWEPSFTERLHEKLGQPFTARNPAYGPIALRTAIGQPSLFGTIEYLGL